MKKIFLHSLRLRNFKGIFEYEQEFSNDGANVFGANESGKSTLYSAFTWLLTGKDEFDRKDYEIKNTARPELNSQAHEVESILFTNEDSLEFEHKLKRVYLERWEKKRGESHKEFKGHKTEFYYNDVPCSATDYEAKVNDIIPSSLIKLLTNPAYFNTLPWERQREGLLKIAGDISNDEVLNKIATPKDDYGTLIMILNANKSIEDHKAELRIKIKKLKDASEQYPHRIDEAKRSKPDAQNWTAIEKTIADLTQKISSLDVQLTDINEALKAQQSVRLTKQKTLGQKQIALMNIENKIKVDIQQAENTSSTEITKLENEMKGVESIIQSFKNDIQNNNTNFYHYQPRLIEIYKEIEQLKADWKSINAETFEFDETACKCPTCKQSLPAEDIAKQKENLLHNFNADVKKRKDKKVADADQLKKEKAQLEEKIAGMDNESITQKINAEEEKLVQLKTKLSTLKLVNSKKVPTDIETLVQAKLKNNADALNLADEIAALQKELDKPVDDTNNNSPALKAEKQQLQNQLDAQKKLLNDKATIERTDKRIQELMTEEEANAQEIARLQRQEFEIETFTRAKMDILEKKVNALFAYVRFRLFEKQVNGAIAETCVCEYQGVPYPTLNTAAKLLAGIDVLNTLSNYYSINAPVFADNRESVTWIPDCNSQLISLFVSPKDIDLRVEDVVNKTKGNTLKKEAA